MSKLGRVLCVDDEPNILRSLQWLLTKKFDVVTASSGQEALKLVKENDFDVVISDQRMPGMTGAELLREVRKISPRSMRMLLTGYSDLQAILRSVNESEVYRFIKKPWEIKSLVKITEEACGIAKSEPAPAFLETSEIKNTEESILLLDDDPEIIKGLKDAMGGKANIIQTSHLAEAVAILSDKNIGIVLANTRLGGRDITGLLKLIKHNMPDIVCVVVSDKTDAEAVIDLINQGQVYRFIPKPLKQGYIKLIIGSALHKRHELKKDPGYSKRHAVEAMSSEATGALLKEIQNLSKSVPAKSEAESIEGEGQFMQRVAGGLKRFFGRA